MLFVSEGLLDRIINTAWQPGFVVLKPLINDLVSTAFTEIINNNFVNFPFDRVFGQNKGSYTIDPSQQEQYTIVN